MKNIFLKASLFFSALFMINVAQAQDGVLNADEFTSAVRNLMDKTMSNPVAGEGGSKPSVIYSMTEQEVCTLLQTNDSSVCSTLAQNLRIEQWVYSDVKGIVSWSIGIFTVLEVSYDANDVALTVDIGAVNDIVSASSLTSLLGDAAQQIAEIIPDQGKLKLRVQALSDSHSIVKLEILEGINHSIDLGNSQELKVKLDEGNYISSDITTNQLVKLGLSFDGLKISVPGSINPLFGNSGPDVELSNSKLKGEVSINPQTGTISGEGILFDTVQLKIDGGNELVSLHGPAPLNFNAVVGNGINVQILENNWSLQAHINTSLLDAPFQGDYKLALSKNDAFEVGEGSASLNLNNVEIKVPTALLRDGIGIPLNQSGLQTQLVLGKIKGQLLVQDDGSGAPTSVGFTGVEVKNISLKTDGVIDASFHNDSVASMIYTKDVNTFADSWNLSGIKDLSIELSSNLANVAAGNQIFDPDQMLSLDIDKVSGELVVKNDGSFQLNQFQISEPNTTGHIILAIDAVPMIDISQTGELNLSVNGSEISLNSAHALGINIATNPMLPATGHISVVNTSGTIFTGTNGNMLVTSGQITMSADTPETAGLLSMGLGGLFGTQDPVVCAAENEPSACSIIVP